MNVLACYNNIWLGRVVVQVSNHKLLHDPIMKRATMALVVECRYRARSTRHQNLARRLVQGCRIYISNSWFHSATLILRSTPLVAYIIAESVAIGRGEVVQNRGTSRTLSCVSMLSLEMKLSMLTIGILHGSYLGISIQIMQQWCEDSPACVQLIVADKIGVIAFQSVKYEGLIGFWNLEV